MRTDTRIFLEDRHQSHAIRRLTHDIATIQAAILRLDADLAVLTEHVALLLEGDDLALVLDRD